MHGPHLKTCSEVLSGGGLSLEEHVLLQNQDEVNNLFFCLHYIGFAVQKLMGLSTARQLLFFATLRMECQSLVKLWTPLSHL